MSYLICLLVGLVGQASASTAPAQTADAVVEQYLVALGGREALGKITSRRSTGTVTVSTPGGDISGPIEIVQKVPNKSRASIRLNLAPVGGDEMTIEQRFDGTSGVALNSMQGDSDLTGNQLENMRNNRLPTPLLAYKEAGTTLELLPGAKIAGKDTIVLLATPKTGSAVRMFFDPETHLLVRTVTKVSSPEFGDIEQTSDLSDYRPADGVKVPFHVVNTNSAQSFSITLTKVEHNVSVDDAVFAKK